jgi:hypothetical protein
MVRLTKKELDAAVAWFEEHQNEKHPEGLAGADIAIRHLDGAGIGQHTVITCEKCESVRADDKNSKYITDYEVW